MQKSVTNFFVTAQRKGMRSQILIGDIIFFLSCPLVVTQYTKFHPGKKDGVQILSVCNLVFPRNYLQVSVVFKVQIM